MKILIVDDNAGFRETLLALLDTDGLSVVGEASSGTEALQMVHRVDPDVVLMDVRMPSMNGIEATRRLKKLRPSVGVVALSGHEDQEIVLDMLVAGASGYVLKDSDGEDILRAVMMAALGGGVLSPAVTPVVIEELTEALARERQRTQELEEAHMELVERSAKRHELVARLGHELRTPVTVILGVAQTMANRATTPIQREELLGRLVRRSQGLARLVERLELTVDAALTEEIDIPSLAREVAEIADGEGRVTVAARDHLPTASISPPVARKVLEELIDNALRFSAGPVDVNVRRGHGRLEVRVVDRGNGIEPANQERIFEALEQLEDLNVRTHAGAGVGLSLARAAARAMDGNVSLESSGAGGSTFLWTVPLDDLPSATPST